MLRVTPRSRRIARTESPIARATTTADEREVRRRRIICACIHSGCRLVRRKKSPPRCSREACSSYDRATCDPGRRVAYVMNSVAVIARRTGKNAGPKPVSQRTRTAVRGRRQIATMLRTPSRASAVRPSAGRRDPRRGVEGFFVSSAVVLPSSNDVCSWPKLSWRASSESTSYFSPGSHLRARRR